MRVSFLRSLPRLLKPSFHIPATILAQRSFSTSIKTLPESSLRPIKVDEEILGADKDEYYPVSVDGIIKGKEGEVFQTVRKLGWGVFSTVWVGRDCAEDASPKYVALKILTKYATREYEEPYARKANEHDILIRTCWGKEPDHRPQKPLYVEQGLSGPPHPGWHRVSGFMGAFFCQDSQHLVIISPLYGESMRDFMHGEPHKRLILPYAKKVAKDTLLALDYLHNRCGVIHCDIKPENILVDFDAGDDIDNVFEAITKLEPNVGRDGRASPLWFPHHLFSKFRIVLTDLGHASWTDFIERSPVDLGSTALRAPELIFGYAYGAEIDIWAFGCTIFELVTGKPLFRFPDSRSPNELAKEPKHHLGLMQTLTGEAFFKEAHVGTSRIEKGFVDSDGWIKPPVIGSTLEELIEKDTPDDIGDKDKFAAFLRRCLRLDYKDRSSASQLLDDPWLAED